MPEQTFIEEFNGFRGIGKTQREAEIACAYAAAFGPLEEKSKEEKTYTFGNLPGWDGKEEANYLALMNH
jgi:hypothetical protein